MLGLEGVLIFQQTKMGLTGEGGGLENRGQCAKLTVYVYTC